MNMINNMPVQGACLSGKQGSSLMADNSALGGKEIVILAAGKGKRMKCELPKALVKLKGRPMIEYLVESCVQSTVDSSPIIVVSPDNKEIISRALTKHNCRYAIQEQQLGTGHALAYARNLIGSSVDHIICLYGDHPLVSAQTIKKVATSHNGVITMMLVKVKDFQGWRQCFKSWGRIVRDAAGQIKESIEYRDASEEIREITEVNPSMFCFEKNWLWENLKKINNYNAQQEYYLTDLVKIAVKQGQKINTYNLDPKEALGINCQEELAVAEELI